jgi:hypothetical protein
MLQIMLLEEDPVSVAIGTYKVIYVLTILCHYGGPNTVY